MSFTKEALVEAERQIDSTPHKLWETVRTLKGKENPARYVHKSHWQKGALTPLRLQII